MIIDYDRRPNATEDEKLQSLVENIQLALNSIDAGTLTGNITNNVSINAGTLNGTIDGDYLFVKNLDADSITAVQGWIDKLLVQTHLLANEGEVFELDAIQVNASRIKTGTLDVERLIYTNQTTGEKYLVHFNPDGSTAYEKLDGNVIEDLTITADKIVSESIMARHITTQNLEGTGGWINLRNGTFFYGNGATYAAANNAISWDGSKLKIKADDFELSSGKSIFEEIEAIETWFYAVAPTTTNEPAKNWNTEKLKELHLRDIYFDTTSGKSYRWAKDGTTYKWVEIEDVELAAVTRRLSDAETSITKNADSIVSLASANETYVKPDGTTATNKLRTQIKQNADAIALKANSTDVYTKAETDSAITVSAQGIEQTVSSTYETKNDATSKLNTAKGYTDSEITSAKASIKITTDEISSEVSKKVGDDEIISKINQSPESITINANRINISTITRERLELHTAYSGSNIVFSASVIYGGEDITARCLDEDFLWYYRTPTGDELITNADGTPKYGKTLTIPQDSQDYGRTVVCSYTRNGYFGLLTNTGNKLMTNTGAYLIGRSEY